MRYYKKYSEKAAEPPAVAIDTTHTAPSQWYPCGWSDEVLLKISLGIL